MLSEKAKDLIRVAMTDRDEADALIAELDKLGAAAEVAALGTTADLTTISGTYAIAGEPTGAEVDATVQALADEVEARMDAMEAKLDELIAALS